MRPYHAAMALDDFIRQVATNIRQARWAAGLTQEQVAAKGISYKHYQEIEAGKREPTLRTLRLLAEVFCVSVADLVVLTGRTNLAELKVDPPRRGRKAAGKGMTTGPKGTGH